jgi:hypothetical protein
MDLPTLSITIECSYWFNIARPYSHKTLEHEFALIVKKKPANQNTELNKYSVLIEQFWSKARTTYKNVLFMKVKYILSVEIYSGTVL